MTTISQKTINSKVSCNGVGLHSGENVVMTLFPAPCDSGIIFKRTDFDGEKGVIKANYKNVVGTNLGTVLNNEFGAKISTVEHLMAAIWGCGIDNLLVEINGPEIPIMDGSSEPFVFLIECAGINVQEEQRRVIEIIKKVRVEEKDKFVEVEPSKEFSIDLHIDFDHQQIQQQQFDYHSTFTSFKNDICRARTFCFKHEIEHLYKMGLAKGGSLDNAIVVDENGVVNEGGLRYSNEFVRHKTLDFIGDIYLAGHYILGHFNASKPGHGINNKLLRELFNDETAWRLI
jgi:UDP-3-O-[3-hydroxymyristoyl] N-acetylglucosamine deacetylase